mmetsp:Transcript_19573/g.32069  ORF Transcript_19573/g.32069 Transcript_19573/m.32069 type:complete len:182 (+) Transcript_19573:888-1433(+)
MAGCGSFNVSGSTITFLRANGNNLISHRLQNWPTLRDIISFWVRLIIFNRYRTQTGISVTGRATHMLMMKATTIVLTTIDCILFSFLSGGFAASKSATDTAADEYRIVFRVCLEADEDIKLTADGTCCLQVGGDITTRGGENPLVYKSAAPKSMPFSLKIMLIIVALTFRYLSTLDDGASL